MRPYVWLVAFAPYLVSAMYVILTLVLSNEASVQLANLGMGLAVLFAVLNIAFMVHVFFEKPEIDKRRQILLFLVLQYPLVIAVMFLAPSIRS